MKNKIRAIGAVCVTAVWLGLALFAWFSPAKDRSAAEKRPLAQFPELSAQSVFGTDQTGAHPFMTGFEKYSLDQFPLRDPFRSLKAVFHSYVLGNKDNNGYYYADGYLAMQDKHLDTAAVDQKLAVLNELFDQQLKDNGGRYYLSMVPDKSYYLAQQHGYPSMDHSQLESMLQQGLPWAQYIDIAPTLELSDYYYTDTHWRQEKLIPTAQLLLTSMGMAGPREEDYTLQPIDRPFYGVYHAQAALPIPGETMYVLQSPLLEGLSVTVDGMAKPGVYDLSKLTSDDAYNIFLSGAKTGLVTVENPNAATDKHLVVFRDSFGSSIAPLFAGDYARLTLIDLRVFSPRMLPMLVDVENADVLILLSALAINNASEAFMH